MAEGLAYIAPLIEEAGEASREALERAGPPEQGLVQEAVSKGYPFGSRYPFGILISGANVTVADAIVYRGGVALEVDGDTITIVADGDWIALKYDPETDVAEYVRWPVADGIPQDKDGYLYRGVHKFGLAGGVATWDRPGWMPGDLAMMGY